MRIARWSAQLLQFNYTVEYQAGKHNFVADALSRLPTNVDAEIASCDEDTEEFVLSCIQAVMKDNSSVSYEELKEATIADSVLQNVKSYIIKGWPGDKKSVREDLKPYFMLQDELSEANECIMRGERVIIPRALQSKIIKHAHSAHQGIVRTKSRVRDLYWFPGMDKLVEEMIKRTVMLVRRMTKITIHLPPPYSQ